MRLEYFQVDTRTKSKTRWRTGSFEKYYLAEARVRQ